MQAIATPTQTPQSPNFLTQDNEPHPAHVFCGRKRRTKYTYDGEGNVLTKTNISTGESVEYTWDHRNRLTKVTFKNSSGTATKIVEYAYDYGQRWVRKTLDSNADETIDESRVFIHDAGQIVLDFEKTGTGSAGNSDLVHRYLWGNSVDQLLADETVDDGSEDDVAWTLTDHLNSVRDLVVYDPVTQTVSVVKHVTYDAYGNVTSDTASGVSSLFLYTGRPFDADTALQNNLNRWYDASTRRWMSVDPIGFEAGDVNLYRYVGNTAPMHIDPLGLAESAGADDVADGGPATTEAFVVYRTGWNAETGRYKWETKILKVTLKVAKVDDAACPKLNVSVEGERICEPEEWNDEWDLPNYWNRETWGTDAEGVEWKWPYLPYLFDYYKGEEETPPNGHYGGFDPGKQVYNDWGAVVVGHRADGSPAKDCASTSPLISARWKAIGEPEGPKHFGDGKKVMHKIISETFSLSPRCQEGEYDVWLIYADLMGHEMIKDAPPEGPSDKYDKRAGGTIAHFVIGYTRDPQLTWTTSVSAGAIPETNFDWDHWDGGSNIIEK